MKLIILDVKKYNPKGKKHIIYIYTRYGNTGLVRRSFFFQTNYEINCHSGLFNIAT